MFLFPLIILSASSIAQALSTSHLIVSCSLALSPQPEFISLVSSARLWAAEGKGHVSFDNPPLTTSSYLKYEYKILCHYTGSMSGCHHLDSNEIQSSLGYLLLPLFASLYFQLHFFPIFSKVYYHFFYIKSIMMWCKKCLGNIDTIDMDPIFL